MCPSGHAARAWGRAAAIAACAAAIGAAGCGRKGPPLVPIVRIPAPVENLQLRRLDDAVYVSFTVPARNVDGSMPPDVTRVELLALEAEVAPPFEDFAGRATRVATITVTAAPTGDRAGAEGAARTASPGERVTVRDVLSPAVPGADPAQRFYLALAYGPRDRRSPGGAVAAVPAGPAAEAPDGLSVTFSPDTIALAWTPSPGVSGYHVYEEADDAASDTGAAEPPVPLTPAPLERPTFEEPVRFGVRRCYRVRALAGEPPIESAASAPACITPEDIFPPRAPSELTAVAGPDGIALRWTPSPDPDVAGYLVLRGTTADDTLLPITGVPVSEPRLLDRDVESGVRYVYAVIAVDNRQPTPNRSPESPRDAVTAR